MHDGQGVCLLSRPWYAAVIHVRIGVPGTVAPGRLRAYREEVGGRAVLGTLPRIAGRRAP